MGEASSIVPPSGLKEIADRCFQAADSLEVAKPIIAWRVDDRSEYRVQIDETCGQFHALARSLLHLNKTIQSSVYSRSDLDLLIDSLGRTLDLVFETWRDPQTKTAQTLWLDLLSSMSREGLSLYPRLDLYLKLLRGFGGGSSEEIQQSRRLTERLLRGQRRQLAFLLSVAHKSDEANGNMALSEGARINRMLPVSLPWDQAHEDRQDTPPLPEEPDAAGEARSELLDSAQRTLLRQHLTKLFDAGKASVFYALTSKSDRQMPKTAVLNLAVLQQMNLHYLQHRVAMFAGRSFRSSEFIPELMDGDTPETEMDCLYYWMERYCKAVRDLDYMKECATQDTYNDPFKMHSSKAVERSILEFVGLLPDHLLPAGVLPVAHDHAAPQLHSVSRNQAHKDEARKRRLWRFGMAAAGRMLLVVPMLIMAIVQGKIASLVTTCVAMLVFAILITWATDLGPNEVLATTAAYAAVLVVFVGTSLAPRTSVGN
ncbi:hypothetical protein LTR53_016429 [Teratosphaeriaceae sp. CCFEE 6253]|nr:hypothetical protein LTR53_016429 [Teratosphaeriaceae sp. CCFEE 6253]